MVIEQKQNQYNIKSGKDVARYLDYFFRMSRQWYNDFVKEINIVNISGIKTYRKHKNVCDKCFALQEKYGIDLVKYIKFFLSKYKFNDANLKKLTDPQNLVWYASDIQIKAKHERVYGYVYKSINNIVRECLEKNFSSAKEYLKYLIENNLLASRLLSGEISRYYIAGIKNIRKIVSKMDVLNQDTLREIVEQQNQLLSDMQDAFMYLKNCHISIINLTDECLFKKQNNNNNNNNSK